MSDMPFDTTQTFIAGEWRSAASNETLSLENPSDGTRAHAHRSRRRGRYRRGRRGGARRAGAAPGAA